MLDVFGRKHMGREMAMVDEDVARTGGRLNKQHVVRAKAPNKLLQKAT